MCGIGFLLGNNGAVNTSAVEECLEVLRRRGPDLTATKSISLEDGGELHLMAAVLHLRGEKIFPQPSEDVDGNVLLWNGEVFGGLDVSPSESDTLKVLQLLSTTLSDAEVVAALAGISGPFSFVYWCSQRRTLYYGRDPVGRRSLVLRKPRVPGEQLAVLSCLPGGNSRNLLGPTEKSADLATPISNPGEAAGSGMFNADRRLFEAVGNSCGPTTTEPGREPEQTERPLDDQEHQPPTTNTTHAAAAAATAAAVRKGDDGGLAWEEVRADGVYSLRCLKSAFPSKGTGLEPVKLPTPVLHAWSCSGDNHGTSLSYGSVKSPSGLAYALPTMEDEERPRYVIHRSPGEGDGIESSSPAHIGLLVKLRESIRRRVHTIPQLSLSSLSSRCTGVHLNDVFAGEAITDAHRLLYRGDTDCLVKQALPSEGVRSDSDTRRDAQAAQERKYEDGDGSKVSTTISCMAPSLSAAEMGKHDGSAVQIPGRERRPSVQTSLRGAQSREKTFPTSRGSGTKGSAQHNGDAEGTTTPLACEKHENYPMPSSKNGRAAFGDTNTAARVGVLFSGGLDSVVVAAMLAEEGADGHGPAVPRGESIDLINVCFDRPSGYCSPDRLASIAAVHELQSRFPHHQWRLICVDTAYDDVLDAAGSVWRVMQPCSTTMDFNIAAAFWFASRGVGRLYRLPPPLPQPHPGQKCNQMRGCATTGSSMSAVTSSVQEGDATPRHKLYAAGETDGTVNAGVEDDARLKAGENNNAGDKTGTEEVPAAAMMVGAEKVDHDQVVKEKGSSKEACVPEGYVSDRVDGLPDNDDDDRGGGRRDEMEDDENMGANTGRSTQSCSLEQGGMYIVDGGASQEHDAGGRCIKPRGKTMDKEKDVAGGWKQEGTSVNGKIKKLNKNGDALCPVDGCRRLFKPGCVFGVCSKCCLKAQQLVASTTSTAAPSTIANTPARPTTRASAVTAASTDDKTGASTLSRGGPDRTGGYDGSQCSGESDGDQVGPVIQAAEVEIASDSETAKREPICQTSGPQVCARANPVSRRSEDLPIGTAAQGRMCVSSPDIVNAVMYGMDGFANATITREQENQHQHQQEQQDDCKARAARQALRALEAHLTEHFEELSPSSTTPFCALELSTLLQRKRSAREVKTGRDLHADSRRRHGVKLCPAHKTSSAGGPPSPRAESKVVKTNGDTGGYDKDDIFGGGEDGRDKLGEAAAQYRHSLSSGFITSKARVLLVGIGADEFMGGYSRHRNAFNRGGTEALQAELLKDQGRLWTRNLGRDDRCIADHGREARFPFLDAAVLAYIRSLQLTDVCNMEEPPGVGDKKILRQVAAHLGLDSCRSLPKRAIQFGSRIAQHCAQHAHGSHRRGSGSCPASTIPRHSQCEKMAMRPESRIVY